MLRNVLADYLNSISERDFDLPFLSLLPEMGFYDVHFTHGREEFGKDFIAKRLDDGIEMQYAFQTKAGDIGQGDWRDIKQQIFEASTNTLIHPNYNLSIPLKVFLVTTGKLKGTAPVDFQDFKRYMEGHHQNLTIDFWGKEQLIDKLEKYGLSGVYNATAKGLINYGNFYSFYGKSLQEYISDREIALYTEQWIDETLTRSQRIRLAVIEGEILANQCLNKGFLYEAIHIYLGVGRAILFELQVTQPADQPLLDLYQQVETRIFDYSKQYFIDFHQQWLAANKDLVGAIQGNSLMMGYLVQCSRVLEVIGFLYFLARTREASLQQEIKDFLLEFVATEPGCTHIAGDYYAVSLILPALVLIDCNANQQVKDFLHQCVKWIGDRYEQGVGLASVEADEQTEINTLLGYSFDFLDIQPNPSSLAATALSDLAAFFGDTKFYEDVVNDIMAVNIAPAYWQPPDTREIYRIDGDNVINFANIKYQETFSDFTLFQFAQHISNEPANYKVVVDVGPLSLLIVMLLLRDRYFPKIWPLFMSPKSGQT